MRSDEFAEAAQRFASRFKDRVGKDGNQSQKYVVQWLDEEPLAGVLQLERFSTASDRLSLPSHDVDDYLHTDKDDQEEQPPPPTVQILYHALVSRTYGIPVMYFRASSPTGPLTRAQTALVLGISPEDPVVDQDEHPYLQTPFFFVHPCLTAGFFAELRRDGCDLDGLLSRWLALVGPRCGLTWQSEQRRPDVSSPGGPYDMHKRTSGDIIE